MTRGGYYYTDFASDTYPIIDGNVLPQRGGNVIRFEDLAFVYEFITERIERLSVFNDSRYRSLTTSCQDRDEPIDAVRWRDAWQEQLTDITGTCMKADYENGSWFASVDELEDDIRDKTLYKQSDLASFNIQRGDPIRKNLIANAFSNLALYNRVLWDSFVTNVSGTSVIHLQTVEGGTFVDEEYVPTAYFLNARYYMSSTGGGQDNWNGTYSGTMTLRSYSLYVDEEVGPNPTLTGTCSNGYCLVHCYAHSRTTGAEVNRWIAIELSAVEGLNIRSTNGGYYEVTITKEMLDAALTACGLPYGLESVRASIYSDVSATPMRLVCGVTTTGFRMTLPS